jgi:ubiquinone/menaquinone biosynthesis C-methylase UbiE
MFLYRLILGGIFMPLSYEEATVELWKDAQYHQLMRDSYLDLNPVEAALRYQDSEEFSEIRRILSRKRTGKVVLDLGAGNGILSSALASCGYRVLALEPENGAITGRKAIKTIQNAMETTFEILEGWGENIPLADASVDVVVARQVLHHAQNLQKMCTEVHRVLKSGGFFLALREHVVRGGEEYKMDLESFLSRHPMHRLTGGENAYTLQFYKQCIKTADFSKLRVYAPWDSILNYAPLRKKDLNPMFANALSKRVPFLKPGVFANILKIPGVSYMLVQVLNAALKTPGRLYSFEAVKQG